MAFYEHVFLTRQDVSGQRVDELVEKLSAPSHLPPCDIATAGDPKVAVKSNFKQEQFESALLRAKLDNQNNNNG